VGVSIYYTATRPQPLSATERAAIDAAIARHPLATVLEACGLAEDEFDGEDFCVYPADAATEPGVVLDGATKLPLCSENTMWEAVQHWCRLLSEVRRAVPGAAWHVHIDDHDIPWIEEVREFDPAG
jgi:hypothetical protein